MVDDMVAAGLVERPPTPATGGASCRAHRRRAPRAGDRARRERGAGGRGRRGHAPALRAGLLGLVERHGHAEAARAGRARALIP